MTEGQGGTAAASVPRDADVSSQPVPEFVVPDNGAGAARDAGAGHGTAAGHGAAAARGASAALSAGAARGAGAAFAAGGSRPADDAVVEPYVRVDARRLESALLALRHPIVSVPLTLEAGGVNRARAERRKLLSQIDDYLLPRLRQSGSPILVALVGSTGAGKSTLLNSLAGMQVSATGIRRPTTNSPVLACHPSDIGWFAENVFLPTLPRVRQQGLAMPGRDGLLVLAASEGMPKGVALLDTPDIDSVVQAHREFAHQFLDASDLWLFMTSAMRYADAAVWDLLQQARDRGAALAIVLSRVPPAAAPQLTSHFVAMLEANGLGETQRFVIPETVVTDARLPTAVAAPVRQWLEETAAQDDRRVAVLTQTMAGVLDTFRARVPALAKQVEDQQAVAAELRSIVAAAYEAGLADLDEAVGNGSLLHGEILARWQDFAGTGDLLRTLQVRRSRNPGRARKRAGAVRAHALGTAIRSSMEALVAAVADRAAENTVARWQQQPAGRALLAGLPPPGAERAASQAPFPSLFDDVGAGTETAVAPDPDEAPGLGAVEALARSSPDLAGRSAQAVSTWQDHVLHLVQTEHLTKRSVSRVMSFDEPSLALVLTVGVLGDGIAGAAEDEDSSTVPQRLLTSLFGAGQLREITAQARLDLHERIGMLLAEETRRFTEIIDSAGAADATLAAELRQASVALEAAR
jgi:energy-coupling factor transporter ATP-binding protein EcfA2